ncbi:MAG: AtpZ/AtpI family protein [Candidatus Kerfeldbacteria bacterium]|nr:AtpZ/AtpI family protein [Candidatus Kerfeldbacteria bacterium]
MTSPTAKTQLWRALGYAWQFGYSIAIPLVVFALAGRWLDRRWSTEPWLLLAGILLAIISSSILLVRKAFQITREIEHQNPPAEPPSTEDPSV